MAVLVPLPPASLRATEPVRAPKLTRKLSPPPPPVSTRPTGPAPLTVNVSLPVPPMRASKPVKLRAALNAAYWDGVVPLIVQVAGGSRPSGCRRRTGCQ